MLILGGRYGSVDPRTSLSYIELEYDHALDQGKPSFAVVIRDGALDDKVRTLSRSAIEQEHPKELKQFREKVLSRICSFFGDSKDIKLAVHETLADFTARHSFSGWVRAEEVASVSKLVDELARVTQRSQELATENASLREQVAKARKGGNITSDDELAEIADLLNATEVTRRTSETAQKTQSVLAWLLIYRDNLVSGIHNRVGNEDWLRFLYFNICPKLAVHELASNDHVPNAKYRRFSLTSKGRALLAYLHRLNPSPSAGKRRRSKTIRTRPVA